MTKRGLTMILLFMLGFYSLCDARTGRIKKELDKMRFTLDLVLRDTLDFREELKELWDTVNKTTTADEAAEKATKSSNVHSLSGEPVTNVSCKCESITASNISDNYSHIVAVTSKRLDNIAAEINLVRKGFKAEKSLTRLMFEKTMDKQSSTDFNVADIETKLAQLNDECANATVNKSEMDEKMSNFDNNINDIYKQLAAQTLQINELTEKLATKTTETQRSTNEHLRLIKVALNSPENGWIPFSKSYYKGFQQKKTWADAMTTCVSLHAHLVEIQSAEENRFLENKILRNHYTWIGGTDKDEESKWKWESSGKRIGTHQEGGHTIQSYENWNSGEPNNAAGNENCLFIYFKNSVMGLWNDDSCGQTHAFVCEMDFSDIM